MDSGVRVSSVESESDDLFCYLSCAQGLLHRLCLSFAGRIACTSDADNLFLFFLNKHDGKPLDVAESSEVRRKLPVERYLTDVDVFLDGC